GDVALSAVAAVLVARKREAAIETQPLRWVRAPPRLCFGLSPLAVFLVDVLHPHNGVTCTSTRAGSPYTFRSDSLTICASSPHTIPVRASSTARASLSTSGRTVGCLGADGSVNSVPLTSAESRLE